MSGTATRTRIKVETRSKKRATRVRNIAGQPIAPTNFVDVYRAASMDRIGAIKAGVPATSVTEIAKSMGMSQERIFLALGLPRATINRKIRTHKALTADEGESVVGFAKLVGQVQVMVEESGKPKGFDAAKWFADWIEEPLPALGGRKPIEFMDTAEGRDLISGILRRMQSGAYA